MSAANRRTNVPVELQPFVVADVRPTGRELGVGSYGSVEEADIQGAICVIKKLHEALLPAPTEAHGADRMIDTFVAECRLMSTLRHPHIVQFLGVCFLTGSRLPALIMEKLLTDLHSFLESNSDIPLTMKRSILVDVAKGLTYLHTRTPPVIHRDLTARNVLLNSAMVAKIADLGNSRIINARPGQLMTMTKTPGNLWYMPPEAQQDTSRYNAAIDIFSFGNLTLFTLTQTFPKVKPATYLSEGLFSRVIGRSEVERRIESIDQISQVLGRQHPLVQLAAHCLNNNPRKRPSIATVLQRLESCRLVPYRSWEANKLEMATDIMGKEREIEILQQQTQAHLQQIETTQTEVQSLQEEKQTQDELIETQRVQIETDQTQIRSLQDEKRTQQELIDLQQRQIKDDRTRIAAVREEKQAQDELIETQRVQIETDQTQIRSLQDEKRTEQELIDLQQRQLEDDHTRIAAVREEKQTQDELIEDQRVQIEMKKRQNETLVQTNRQQIITYEDSKREQQRQIELLESEILSQHQISAAKELTIKHQQEEISSVRRDFEIQSQAQLTSKQAQIDHLETQMQLTSKQFEIDAKQAEIDAKQAENDSKQAQINALETQMRSQLMSKQAEIAALETEVQMLRQQTDTQWQAQREELERQHKLVTSLETQLRDLTTQVSSTNSCVYLKPSLFQVITHCNKEF